LKRWRLFRSWVFDAGTIMFEELLLLPSRCACDAPCGDAHEQSIGSDRERADHRAHSENHEELEKGRHLTGAPAA
jgi:hypothetical protein